MLQHKFGGSVVVNGSQRLLTIDGNPLGRTVILVDGVTVYNKKPFIHRETIDFDVVPGKKATLRWQQVSLKGMECDITVDGNTTTVAPVTPNGSVAKPVGAKQRGEFKGRMSGAALAALGALFLVLNYFEIQRGTYYPKYLAVTPLLMVNGFILLANPSLDLSSAARKRGFVALAVVLLVFGWFFKNWFLNAFAPQ